MHRVDGAPLKELRKRTSSKWFLYPEDVLPMWVAEMDFEVAKPIRDVLIEMVKGSDTGYLRNKVPLAESFARFTQMRWKWEVDPEQFFLCTDVGVGMIEISRQIVLPGDQIMINTPVYNNMRLSWIPELKCATYDAPLVKDGMHYTLDLRAIEEGYKKGVKLHFLCNPHNPVGTVYSREELIKIAELAKEYGVFVLSDEIHAPLTFREAEFVPFLSVSDAAREVGVCVTSASKSWNLAGLKCAQIVTSHPRTAALATAMPESVRFRASLLGARASAVAYECVDWLDDALETLDRNRKAIAIQLAAKLPSVEYRAPNTSYLAWIDLSSLNLGGDPSATLLERGRVAFSPGSIFGPDTAQFIRLNFATSLDLLTDGIDRIVASV